MTRTDQDSVALLRIGSVTAVKTSGIEITVDADKNEPSILYNGNIIDNVTIGKHVVIHRGYRKLVVRVEEEYLTEDRQWRDDEYHRDEDRYTRTLRAILQGELIDGTFERGRTIVPMIGNTAYIATKQQIDEVFGSGDPSPDGTTNRPTPPTLEIGSLNSDPSVRFRLDIGKLFASHVGIFGNTGSGKSYTLTQLYTQLFKRIFPQQTANTEGKLENKELNTSNDKQSEFLIFDLNGEYTSDKPGDTLCSSDYKQIFTPRVPKNDSSGHATATHTTSDTPNKPTKDHAGEQVQLSDEILFEPDFWFTVLEATEKTQRPFIERSLHQFSDSKIKDSTASWLTLKSIRKLLSQLLESANPRETDITLVFSYLHDIHDIVDKDFDRFDSAMQILKEKLRYNSTSGEFYFTGPTFGIYNTSDKRYEDRIFHSDPSFLAVVKKFTRQAFSHRTAPKLDAINLIKSKFLTQFYTDVASGFSNVSHLRPLIARLNHRSKMLTQCFHFIGTEDMSNPPVTIINLRYCSIEERKLIPLLVTRARYKTQKDSFHSDRYLNIIIDEAHNLLSYESSQESETWRNTRLEMFEEVLKEGRKFGVFVTLASQRPHDISPTITSQLHHYFLHQLVNPKDIDAVRGAVSYLDAKSFAELSSLPQGTCIISGTSVQIPAIVKIDKLNEGETPNNETINLVKLWGLAPDSPEDAGDTSSDSADSQDSESTAEES